MDAAEILVGIDGSVAGREAMRWATQEAQRHGWSIRLVHAYEPGRTRREASTRRLRAEQTLAEGLAVVRAANADVAVCAHAVPGSAVGVLLDGSRDAVLTVVGTRGRGSFLGQMLGSVSQEIAERAFSPVVVVHDAVPHDGPVVVGVDDSAAAEAAVGLAFELADVRRADLVAVRAYSADRAWSVDHLAPLSYVRAEVEAQQRLALEDVLAPWRDKYPDVHAESLVVSGRPSPFLLGAAHAAALVVVGRGGFPWSVDTRLICHAACPVAVVPEPAAW